MLDDRNLLTAELILEHMRSARVGIIVRDITDIEPSIVANHIAAKVEHPLYVAYIGNYSVSDIPATVTMADNIESAVAWRNDPGCAGHIIVFIQGESRKSHSLSEFDDFTARDLAKHLINVTESLLTANEPQTQFWSALRNEAANFPLKMLEEFVLAVQRNQDNPQVIIDNMWRIGLMRDAAILNRGENVAQRIRRNREIIEKMGQLSEQSRRRIGSVLTKARGADVDRLRQAFVLIKEFFVRGNRDVLRQLDLSTAEGLLEQGRPFPVRANPQDQQDKDVSQEPKVNEEDEEEENSTRNPDKPLQGRQLQHVISQLAVSGSDDAQHGLRQLGEYLKRKLENPQEPEAEFTPTVGFAGRAVNPTISTEKLSQLIGHVCADNRWGGKLTTSKHTLKEAIQDATPEDIEVYNPDDPAQGPAGQCLFSLLRAFETHLPSGVSFSRTLDQLIASRNRLIQDLDLLLNHPIVLFGGYPEVRQVLYNYLDAYAELLRIFKEHSGRLHQFDSMATRFMAAELIRLDTIYIRRIDGDIHESWKAMITPLHPLHLWRFREIFNAIHEDHRRLTDEEQQKLADVLPDLPHLLHYLILSQNVTGDIIVLPQSGTLDNLPTYENHTNRYLGDDGADFIKELLTKWLDYAPYSRPQIRLGVVDIPSLHIMLKSASDFLKLKWQTDIVIHCYHTNEQNYTGELAKLDFEDRDHEIADAMRTKRLILHLHPRSKVEALITQMEQQPVHILYMFDQSQYQIEYGPRAHQLLVSPLVVSHDYTYNKVFKRGTITPSSDTDDGVFSHYHFLVQQVAELPAGKQIRLQYNPEAELTPINNVLRTEAARWLVLADRVLTNYHPENGVPMGVKRGNRREIGVWSRVTDQAIRRFINLLRRYNLQPDKETVTQLLQKYGHIATEGVISLAIIGGTSAQEAGQKGLLGKLLAIKWYIRRYPDALIASLDSSLAHQWLQERTESNERADLIGLRMVGKKLIVEPIEVKTREGTADVRIISDPINGRSMLAGHAVEQLGAMIETLEPIFGGANAQPLFTPARREVLRYQLQRECFHEVHVPMWQETWHERLSQAFARPAPTIPVECRGLIIHIRLDEGDGELVNEYSSQMLSLAQLGSKTIQPLVVPDLEHPEAVVSEESEITAFETTGRIEPDPDVVISEATADVKAIDTQKPDYNAPIATDTQDVQSVSINVEKEKLGKPVDLPNVLVDKAKERAEVEEISRSFLRACQSYRIQVDSCDPRRAIIGPSVWRFYVRLSRGQRLDLLRNVLEDIGREMARSNLLVSQIPNSEEIALDIPRLGSERKPVLVRQGLLRLPSISSPEQLPILIGVTPEGEDIVRNLGQMPHLLVGGTTGSGKTVFLYSLLLSLLHTHPDPQTLRLFMSTSKPEDFSFFHNLPHLEQGRVIADAGEAVRSLQTCIVTLFNEREKLLMSASARDIGEYNRQQKNFLPPFVIIVDEFADLADQLAHDKTGQREFYTQLRRVAQLGRNRGVHLVLCTQRPSADLVPTNIRNLMNNRVALRVNDAIASRMILDEPGAESLQMHGDLLFKEETKLTRAQGYFTDSEDLRHLIQDIIRGIASTGS